MKYYSEEEIERTLKQLGYMTATPGIISNMQPVILPTLESTYSDRERIRMELWTRAYLDCSGLLRNSDVARLALAAFDKQFPK